MKKFKPSYIVDITKCEDTLDMIVAIAYAKVDANVAITRDELDAVIVLSAYDLKNFVEATAVKFSEMVINTLNKCVEKKEPKKKPNIFKRFWNWMTKKN